MTLRKSLAWIAAGGVGGALATALLLDGENAAATSAAGPASLVEAVADFARGRESDARTNTVAEQLDAFREAQQESDPEALVRSLERAAGRDWSPERDVEIDALLGRLAELAPDYAAPLAESLGLDHAFVAQAWLIWAEADPDAALAALPRIANTAMRRDVALALTDVIGDDARGVDRIGAALAPADRDALRIAWLAERASTDPYGAFREAANIGDPALARRALEQVAIAWAAEDPSAALSQAELLPTNLTQGFRARVFTEWARLDAEGFVAYLESQATMPTEAMSGLQYLLATNPDLVEGVASGISGDMAMSMRLMAMQSRATRDPAAAKAEAAAMPPGEQRDQAIQVVAQALARTDPRAAIEWVQGLSPPVANGMESVLMTIAQTDIGLALDLLDDPRMAGNTQMALALATSSGVSDPAQAPLIAERLVTRTDPESRAALSRLVGNWMQRDPEAALDWVLGHGTEIDQNVMASAARTMATRNPVAAASFTDRIPPAQRSAWIVQVASGYGSRDPQAAMNWVSQYQGQEFYDLAVRQLITSAAATDPAAAAQLLRQSSPTVQFGAAQQVAQALAQQGDPRAALSWAETLADPRARSSAQVAAATAWYGTEPDSARRYVLAQLAGANRDQMARNLFQRAAIAGSFDRELLNGISDAAARQALASQSITLIARTNAPLARSLLASEITDPALRATISAQIDQNAPR